MATGRDEWKETGKGLGDAFGGLAKALVRTGTAGFTKAEKWAKDEKEAEENGSSVFSDGTWRETGKDLGNAFKNLGGSILGSVERGAGKAEEWAEGAREKTEETIHKTADKADDMAEDFKECSSQFAQGMQEADAAGEVVADAEVVSEEIVE